MKKLYQKLAVTFVLSTFLIAILFTMGLYRRSREENRHYLEQLLESTSVNLENTTADQEERLSILKDDYLKRAWAVEYILKNDYDEISESEGLSLIMELMEVKSICAVSSSGEILLTTSPDSGDMYDDPQELEALFSSLDEKAYVIRADTPVLTGEPLCFHVLVRSDSEDFSAVRIDADAVRLGLMDRENIIKSTLKQATTEFSTSIFAVDKNTGKVLGITENNDQRLQIEGVSNEEELLKFLDSGKDKGSFLVKIDGKICQAVVQSIDGVYLAAFSDMEKVFGSVAKTFAEGLLGIGGISVMTVLLVRYHIKRMEKELSLARTEAKYDKLTGLYNRSGFEQCIESFLSQEAKGVLLLLDLDNFKSINDGEGHPEGDRILERFANCLSRVFRREDSIGRLGGDEFIVLIQNELPQGILEEKLNTVLYEVRIMLGSYREKYGASVSIGAVPIDGSVKSYEALYKYADAALYIAKYMGKNRYYINDKKITCAKEECSFYVNDVKESPQRDKTAIDNLSDKESSEKCMSEKSEKKGD